MGKLGDLISCFFRSYVPAHVPESVGSEAVETVPSENEQNFIIGNKSIQLFQSELDYIKAKY